MKYIRDDGTIFTALITEGQGTSAFYHAHQIKRDTPLFEGAHCYLDHPTTTEQVTRPERSVRDLAAVVHNPRYLEAGPEGPGAYGDVEVLAPWRPYIEEIAPHIGMSIRASGTTKVENIGGKNTVVAERFTAVRSVDFVTKAGRGGKLVPMTESARSNAFVEAQAAFDKYLKDNEIEESNVIAADFIEAMRPTEGTREGNMPDNKELQEAQASVVTLTKEKVTLTEENKRLSEAICLRDARNQIAVALVESTLPDVTKARLLESLPKAAPMKEAHLDAETFAAQIKDAITAETKYLQEATSAPRPGIRGMGSAEAADGGTGVKLLYEQRLRHYLKEGLPQDRAERMAKTFSEAGR